jgi:hypothetical protein
MFIKLEDYLADIDKLSNKYILQYNIKELLSFIIYNRMFQHYNIDKLNEKFNTQELLDNILAQNIIGFPKITIAYNTYYDRYDGTCSSEFLYSENILTLLFRIIYLEHGKKNSVLQYNFSKNINMDIDEYFILFVEEFIDYYMCIYNNPRNIENQIAYRIKQNVSRQ